MNKAKVRRKKITFKKYSHIYYYSEEENSFKKMKIKTKF